MTEIDGTERYHIPKKQELIGQNFGGFTTQNVASGGARRGLWITTLMRSLLLAQAQHS